MPLGACKPCAALLSSTDDAIITPMYIVSTLSLILQRREQAAIVNRAYANNFGNSLRTGPRGVDKASCILQIYSIPIHKMKFSAKKIGGVKKVLVCSNTCGMCYLIT